MPESITISSLDEKSARWIENEAKKRKMNKEAVALLLIHKGIECEHFELKTYDDLDFLAGTWSKEQSTEFMNSISHFDQVDENLWR